MKVLFVLSVFSFVDLPPPPTGPLGLICFFLQTRRWRDSDIVIYQSNHRRAGIGEQWNRRQRRSGTVGCYTWPQHHRQAFSGRQSGVRGSCPRYSSQGLRKYQTSFVSPRSSWYQMLPPPSPSPLHLLSLSLFSQFLSSFPIPTTIETFVRSNSAPAKIRDLQNEKLKNGELMRLCWAPLILSLYLSTFSFSLYLSLEQISDGRVPPR